MNKLIAKQRNFDAAVVQDDRPKPTIFKSVTYIEGLSERIKKVICGELTDTMISFKPRKTVQRLHTAVKQQEERGKESGVIYEISCLDCPVTYIGQTGRYVETRMSEHRRSERNATQVPDKVTISKDGQRVFHDKTALQQHVEKAGHHFDFDGFKIIGYERNRRKIEIMEALRIGSSTVACNYRSDSQRICATYGRIIEMTK